MKTKILTKICKLKESKKLMNDEKISVIIPIYNAEKTLDRCLDSVVKQTYKNLEIILLNDGSKDESANICNKWKSADERIIVVNKNNSGSADTRNKGLDLSTGEYILFIDSDDFVDHTICEKLLHALKSNNADISMCGYNNYYNENKIIPVVENSFAGNIDVKKLFRSYALYNWIFENDVIFTDNIMASIWRVLYKKEVVDKVRFEHIRFSEDMLFNLRAINKDCKVTFVNENLYNYVLVGDSVVRSEFNILKLCEMEKSFLKLFQEMELRLDEEMFRNYKFFIYKQMILSAYTSTHKKELLKYIKKSKFLRGLRNFKNFKYHNKHTRSFKEKVKNFLIFCKMGILLNLLLKK